MQLAAVPQTSAADRVVVDLEEAAENPVPEVVHPADRGIAVVDREAAARPEEGRQARSASDLAGHADRAALVARSPQCPRVSGDTQSNWDDRVHGAGRASLTAHRSSR